MYTYIHIYHAVYIYTSRVIYIHTSRVYIYTSHIYIYILGPNKSHKSKRRYSSDPCLLLILQKYLLFNQEGTYKMGQV